MKKFLILSASLVLLFVSCEMNVPEKIWLSGEKNNVEKENVIKNENSEEKKQNECRKEEINQKNEDQEEETKIEESEKEENAAKESTEEDVKTEEEVKSEEKPKISIEEETEEKKIDDELKAEISDEDKSEQLKEKDVQPEVKEIAHPEKETKPEEKEYETIEKETETEVKIEDQFEETKYEEKNKTNQEEESNPEEKLNEQLKEETKPEEKTNEHLNEEIKPEEKTNEQLNEEIKHEEKTNEQLKEETKPEEKTNEQLNEEIKTEEKKQEHLEEEESKLKENKEQSEQEIPQEVTSENNVEQTEPPQNTVLEKIVFDDYSETNPMPLKPWTVMIYLPENNREKSFSFINSLEEADLSEDMNLIVFYDGNTDSESNEYASSLIRIRKDESDEKGKINSPLCSIEKKDYNFGAQETLTYFVDFTKSVYPSQKYGIVFCNQSENEISKRQPVFSIAKDSIFNDFLFIDEAKESLEKSFAQEKLQFTLLDMNFGSSLEYAAELKDVSETLGGIESYVNDSPIDYSKWLTTVTDKCADGKSVLMNLSDTYGTVKNRFAVLDLSLVDQILQKLNEFSVECAKKLINQTQKNMVCDKYVAKIEAQYADFVESETKYVNLSDFIKKIRNKYYTILTDKDNEIQSLIDQTICNVDLKATKSWVFGKFPLSFCYCSINESNEENSSVPQKINNASTNINILNAAKLADSFYAGNEINPSLIDRLLLEIFGGNTNE